MSIQWTFVAGYLYFEIALVAIMIMPIFSPKRWHQFFRSRLFAMFQTNAAFYFSVFLAFLIILLIDAIREMRKYSHSSDTGVTGIAGELKGNVKLFRAQRNFYITGFSIFLTFVIRRLVKMLIIQDELSIKAEKIIKEAEATVKLAKSTVLANTLQTNEARDYDAVKTQLEVTESELVAEKKRVKELEEEATKWRLKYEEIANRNEGKGDE